MTTSNGKSARASQNSNSSGSGRRRNRGRRARSDTRPREVIANVIVVVDMILDEVVVIAKVIEDQVLHYVKYVAGSIDSIGSCGSHRRSNSRRHRPDHFCYY